MATTAPLTLWLTFNSSHVKGDGVSGEKSLVSVQLRPDWTAREVQVALLKTVGLCHTLPHPAPAPDNYSASHSSPVLHNSLATDISTTACTRPSDTTNSACIPSDNTDSNCNPLTDTKHLENTFIDITNSGCPQLTKTTSSDSTPVTSSKLDDKKSPKSSQSTHNASSSLSKCAVNDIPSVNTKSSDTQASSLAMSSPVSSIISNVTSHPIPNHRHSFPSKSTISSAPTSQANHSSVHHKLSKDATNSIESTLLEQSKSSTEKNTPSSKHIRSATHSTSTSPHTKFLEDADSKASTSHLANIIFHLENSAHPVNTSTKKCTTSASQSTRSDDTTASHVTLTSTLASTSTSFTTSQNPTPSLSTTTTPSQSTPLHSTTPQSTPLQSTTPQSTTPQSTPSQPTSHSRRPSFRDQRIVKVRNSEGALLPLTPSTLHSTPQQPLHLEICTLQPEVNSTDDDEDELPPMPPSFKKTVEGIIRRMELRLSVVEAGMAGVEGRRAALLEEELRRIQDALAFMARRLDLTPAPDWLTQQKA